MDVMQVKKLLVYKRALSFGPFEAVWKTKHYDIPIVVTGYVGPGEDDQHYFTVEGSNSCIPFSEIEMQRHKNI